MRFKIGLIAIAAGVLAATTGTPAVAAPTSQAITRCGQAITAEYVYLTRDLVCTQGFSVARGDAESPPITVTIDLRGHRLSGQGGGAGVSFSGNRFQGGDVFVVKNGRISNWAVGASAGSYPAITVSKVTFDGNDVGVYCEAECSIKDSIFKSNRVGLLDYYNSNVVRTAFVGNKVGLDASFYDVVSGTGISYSSFDSNDVGIIASANLHGVGVSKSVFTRNGVGLTSASDVDSPSISAVDNVFAKNRDGIFVKPTVDYFAAGVGLGRNTTLLNSRYGIYAPGATDLGGNKAAGNGQPCVGVVCGKP